jgi:MoaA/NifB/PqqE/SkfB family radical SAM enzyme
VQEAYTQVGLFEAVLDGVRASVAAGIPTYVSYVCSKETWGDVPEVLRLAAGLGVRGVDLHNLLPHFDAAENESRFWDLVLSTDDAWRVEQLRDLPEARLVRSYPVLISRGRTRRSCEAPWNTIGINGNGSITICNSVHPPRRENGKLADPVLWQNAYCGEFRGGLAEDRNASCRQCFRNWQGVRPEVEPKCVGQDSQPVLRR